MKMKVVKRTSLFLETTDQSRPWAHDLGLVSGSSVLNLRILDEVDRRAGPFTEGMECEVHITPKTKSLQIDDNVAFTLPGKIPYSISKLR